MGKILGSEMLLNLAAGSYGFRRRGFATRPEGMIFCLLKVLLLPTVAIAGAFSKETIQPYPSSWPALAGMSANCAEVQGSYIDPNERRWKHEQQPDSLYGEKLGPQYDKAWIAFGLSPKEVQHETRYAVPRVFSIEMAADRTVLVKYTIGGMLVSSRSFGRGQWSCNAEGLVLTVFDRKGRGIDKVPYHGHSITRATLYRVREHLYVKSERRSKDWLLHVVPQSYHDVDWLRFVGERQLATPALAAGSVLRMNAARQAFNEEYQQAKGSKAFAQAPEGSWGWVADRASPRVAAEDAVARCNKHLKSHHKPCTVVHMDDWWTVAQ